MKATDKIKRDGKVLSLSTFNYQNIILTSEKEKVAGRGGMEGTGRGREGGSTWRKTYLKTYFHNVDGYVKINRSKLN